MRVRLTLLPALLLVATSCGASAEPDPQPQAEPTAAESAPGTDNQRLEQLMSGDAVSIFEAMFDVERELATCLVDETGFSVKNGFGDVDQSLFSQPMCGTTLFEVLGDG